ncbi:hypothetical protein METH109765_23360 [Mesobacillus thioparans]
MYKVIGTLSLYSILFLPSRSINIQEHPLGAFLL